MAQVISPNNGGTIKKLTKLHLTQNQWIRFDSPISQTNDYRLIEISRVIYPPCLPRVYQRVARQTFHQTVVLEPMILFQNEHLPCFRIITR